MSKQVKVGSVIKSFDFPEKQTCYLIGRVTKLEGCYIYCEVISQVFSGEVVPDDELPETFRVPKQGEMMLDAKFERIVVILE